MELTLTIAVAIFIMVSIYTIIGAYKRQHKAKEESKVPNFSDYAEDSKLKTEIDNYPFLDHIRWIDGMLYISPHSYRVQYFGPQEPVLQRYPDKSRYDLVKYPRFNFVKRQYYNDDEILNICKILQYDKRTKSQKKHHFKFEYHDNVRNPIPDVIEQERIKNEQFLKRYKQFI